MFRFFARFLLLVLLPVAAYCFWPRTTSLAAFRPIQMARLQVNMLRLAEEGKPRELLVTAYRLFEGEYKVPPLSAAPAAWNYSEALLVFHRAADQADQDLALPFLERAFAILGKTASSPFDVSVVARLELFGWMLAGDRSKQKQLAAVIGEKLALLYGGSAQNYEPVAAALATARRSAAENNWSKAGEAEGEAWQRLRALLDENQPAR